MCTLFRTPCVLCYWLPNGWTLQIDVDDVNTQVFKIKKGEKDLLLTPYTLKTNEMDKKSGMTHQNVRESFETVGTGVRVVRPIAVPVINGITVADERNQSVGMGESSAPYDTSARSNSKEGEN